MNAVGRGYLGRGEQRESWLSLYIWRKAKWIAGIASAERQ